MTLCKAISQHIQSKTNKSTIKNISHKKKWNAGTIQMHMDPSPIPLIKSNNGEKSDKDCVKIKLRRTIVMKVGPL